MHTKLINLIVGGAMIAGVAGGGYSASQIQQQIEGSRQPTGLDLHETHAAASLLGQVRSTSSGWLWLRTDLYLHNGVELRKLSRAELEAGKTGVGSSDNDDHALHDDSKIVTVIPPRNKDFRGILGDLERATSAYKEMMNHEHNDPKAALPLFRLMTWIDPRFIRGWTTGASVIARDRSATATARALAMLDDGLKQNPNSLEILTDIGEIQCVRKRDFRRSSHTLLQACQIGEQNWYRLNDDETEALLVAFRWLALSYRELGDRRSCSTAARRGLSLFPEDGTLSRLSSQF